MTARRVVVLGYGMAGARLADEIRNRDPEAERVALTVVGAEPHAAYNRVLLSAVVAGTMQPDSVRLHDEGWAQRNHVELRLNVAARRIDRRHRTVRLDDGTALPYDSLVLATGSRPWLPPVEGLIGDDGEPTDGALAFRSLDDCDRILDAARVGAPVAVLGGGLLGLEAARGLAGRGNRVTVVHPAPHPMERQLDPGAGRVLAGTLEASGIDFRLGRGAARYLPGDGLKLDDGSHVSAELLVVSTGVRAETALAADAGLAVEAGVVVDDQLRTSDGRIHAIGDCAQHPAAPGGLVQPAWEQASVLADLLTGADTASRYRGTSVVTRLKAKGVDVMALGDTVVAADTAAEDTEVLCVDDPARGRYAKLVVRDEKVAGAIVLGFPDAAATITQLYDRGVRVPEDRLALLLGRALPSASPAAASPADLPGSAIVCRCNSVSKAKIVDAYRGGASTVDDIAQRTRAGTGCGGCRDAVCGIAEWLTSTD
ncbi:MULTISPECIES: FAD-dependent oxidoreductase [Prauserella salsuginis group]|uniref:FAD-dependent oxidoreductase n=1 Tax=Prauserella salsuginis TaxID=387889 RepID=A0ABW6G6F7_9PSEU|nr:MULTISPECIES: FAD-dependent oxidoreductase [Prauserella salsuginis group]MCR3722800.1 assimilatory nitrate reductase electron transfer subunit [Prauserella flava]MCR3737145.1 assimilatory nitrate reductase electron transfer subunit [Prauserella salsuginis]